MTRRHVRSAVAALLALACLATASCSSDPASDADAGQQGESVALPPYLQGLPWDEDLSDPKLRAVQLDELAKIDPCALHDVAAAEQATGQRGGDLEPGKKLHECALRTEGDNGAGWNLYVRVGETILNQQRDDYAPVDIGDTEFLRTEMDGCRYEYIPKKGTQPLYGFYGGAMTFSLSVQYSAAAGESDAQETQNAARGCGVGAKYLNAIKQHWEPGSVAKRDDGVTQPTAPLGNYSPCAAMKEAMNVVPPLPSTIDTRLDRTEPSNCEVNDYVPGRFGSETSEPRINVTFEFDDDPTQNADLYEPVTIGNLQGFVRAPDPDRALSADDPCTVELRYGEAEVDMNAERPGEQIITQVIRVQTPDCESSKKVAELVAPTVNA